MRESTLGGTMGDNVYGVASPTHKTKCRHSNNPNGHNRECGCGWFARSQRPQVIPYAKQDLVAILPESKHPSEEIA